MFYIFPISFSSTQCYNGSIKGDMLHRISLTRNARTVISI